MSTYRKTSEILCPTCYRHFVIMEYCIQSVCMEYVTLQCDCGINFPHDKHCVTPEELEKLWKERHIIKE